MSPEHLILGQIYPPTHHFTKEQSIQYLSLAKAMDLHLEQDHLNIARHATLYHKGKYSNTKKDMSTWMRDRLNTPFIGATKLYGVVNLDTNDLVAIAFVKSIPFIKFSTIAGVYVVPEYRHKGIFKYIHEYIKNIVDTEELQLHTVIGTKIGNTPIEKIYLNLGYKLRSTTYITPMSHIADMAHHHNTSYYPNKDFKLVLSDPSPFEAHIGAAIHKYNLYKRITLLDTKHNDPYFQMKIVEDQYYDRDDIRWILYDPKNYDISRYDVIVDICTKELHSTLLDISPHLKVIAYEVPNDTTTVIHDILNGTPTYHKWYLPL